MDLLLRGNGVVWALIVLGVPLLPACSDSSDTEQSIGKLHRVAEPRVAQPAQRNGSRGQPQQSASSGSSRDVFVTPAAHLFEPPPVPIPEERGSRRASPEIPETNGPCRLPDVAGATGQHGPGSKPARHSGATRRLPAVERNASCEQSSLAEASAEPKAIDDELLEDAAADRVSASLPAMLRVPAVASESPTPSESPDDSQIDIESREERTKRPVARVRGMRSQSSVQPSRPTPRDGGGAPSEDPHEQLAESEVSADDSMASKEALEGRREGPGQLDWSSGAATSESHILLKPTQPADEQPAASPAPLNSVNSDSERAKSMPLRGTDDSPKIQPENQPESQPESPPPRSVRDVPWRPLPIPVGSSERTQPKLELEESVFRVIGTRVLQHAREAESLASRGAFYAARAEMIEALRVLTQALDRQRRNTDHSEALAAAMRALEEAADFAARGSELEAELDLSQIVSGHRTPVLQEISVEHLSPVTAQQRYLEFAQEQFAKACGHLPAGSYALYGLGRIYGVMQEAEVDSQLLCLPKAVTLHQAALLVDSRNAKAANELGVLLARLGQFEDARRVLRHATSIRPEPAMWLNLSAVHEHLGQTNLAQQARQEGQRMAVRLGTNGNAVGSSGDRVQWVDVEAFSRAPALTEP